MTVRDLPPGRAARMRSAPFTYDDVGATATAPPAGWPVLRRSAPLRRRDFDGAAQDLLSWRLHEGAGLQVAASDTPLREGSVVLLRLGWGPASLRIPCRVVYVVDEPDVRGFAYGTLPGHPERGEERFVVRRDHDGLVSVEVAAFSRPASRLATLGGPVTRGVQSLMTNRYLRALDR